MQTAKSIAEFVAPFVGMAYPNDKDKLFQLLSLVQDEIWKAGLFDGSTKYFQVDVRDDNTIITPPGYNILLGCNLNFKPTQINSVYYMFHSNGPGETPLHDKNFYPAIQFLGDSPVIRQPTDCENFYVTVRGQSCSQKQYTVISAFGPDGRPIYTYEKDPESDEPTIGGTEEDVEMIEGIKYPILGQTVSWPNILISEVYGIVKEPGLVPVEYFLTDKRTGVGRLMARMEPWEITTNYKRYQISGRCVNRGRVLGLFKRSKPSDLFHESQQFICEDKNAILSMSKGLNEMYDKDNVQGGDNYIVRSVQTLSRGLREGQPNSEDKLQINSPRSFSRIKRFA